MRTNPKLIQFKYGDFDEIIDNLFVVKNKRQAIKHIKRLIKFNSKGNRLDFSNKYLEFPSIIYDNGCGKEIQLDYEYEKIDFKKD